ncbi:transcriptional repressor [Bacteroides fragilis]|jgi:Fur family ferric uptake transcriptional regulator|uniref:Transcriptional repressor n=3 Tax=Bacteroides TaxID=816 RepID=A0A2K9GWM4_BACFG|nr:transcriptional repressor [Bacteroides fragilis]QLK82627.1 transcriptional repressor [Bacteroides sp. PHL 2737]QCQ32058.1 transcriptional repressor [Bacteroides fragilis]QCQ36384.1 transcriptional repressor [Bacteroides fragilis]QCQ45214.1 transcriptional repressor [Bacteroides fragilis]
MRMENLCLKILEQRGIKPTAIRMLVLKAMIDAEQAVSLLDLENKLDTVDKSSIFRTITLFVSQHLAHSVDDGTGSLKYAVCDSECTCAVKDLHTHFYCEYCHKTFCLENIHVPVVDLPEGFAVRSINYVLKGCCAECAAELKKGH